MQSQPAVLFEGAQILELGSGTGLAGLFAAAGLGASVLLTDVPSVVELLQHNVQANSETGERASHPAAGGREAHSLCGLGHAHRGPRSEETNAAESSDTCVGARTCPEAAKREVHAAVDAIIAESTSPVRQTSQWRRASPVGAGSAATARLDWTVPIGEQVGIDDNDPRDAHVVLACEVVWLAELVQPFVGTLAEVLRGPHRPPCLMTYTDRGTVQSTTFAHRDMVLRCMDSNGLAVEELLELQGYTADGEPVHAWRVTLQT